VELGFDREDGDLRDHRCASWIDKGLAKDGMTGPSLARAALRRSPPALLWSAPRWQTRPSRPGSQARTAHFTPAAALSGTDPALPGATLARGSPV
jgi:hypothetical protein